MVDTFTENGFLLITEIRKIAGQFPNRVLGRGNSDGCLYIDPDAKCGKCIVGTALFNLGWITVDQMLNDGSAASDLNGRQWRMFVRHPSNLYWSKSLNNSEKEWVNEVQTNQDNGFAWAECVIKADKRMFEILLYENNRYVEVNKDLNEKIQKSRELINQSWEALRG